MSTADGTWTLSWVDGVCVATGPLVPQGATVKVVAAPLELWGSGEICAELDVTRTTLRRWRDGGGFPAPGWTINGGRTEVWDAAAVRAWDAERRAAAQQ